jgi:L-seryl-tRNA(Ser) seleniumtransferase
MTTLKSLPSVDQLLSTNTVNEFIESFGRPLTLQAIRAALDEIRLTFPKSKSIPDQESIINRTKQILMDWTTPSLLPVINATGVILHTNLGRAPLSYDALEAINQISVNYSNLEYDSSKGQRGSRTIHIENLLTRLTGAEAALVVNNNAAAVLLILTALARRRRVVIARTQLVEIGGGFRLPDVMKQSGAKLVEVGTTNRVHLADFENAIIEQPIAMLLRAHRSNFKIIGFTSEPSLKEMADLAKSASIPIVDDLGSGTLLETTDFGLGHEPMVQESLTNGADLVCFSGDKLLGGPQAGIIVGRKNLITKLKKHPLARAIRADKICLAALSATLLHYLKNEAQLKIPIWRIISIPLNELQRRVQNWVSLLGEGEMIPGQSTVGGGSLPEETLPTFLLSLSTRNPEKFLSLLRSNQIPVIARIKDNKVILDPRTVLPEQDQILITSIQKIIKEEA